jgi:hypothetical protein
MLLRKLGIDIAAPVEPFVRAIEARLRARWLAPGPERDRLIRKARRCETGAVGLRWATSLELQPPR